MQMKTFQVPGEFQPARFEERLNRFVARVKIDGEEVLAHVPTSGRLGELLLPGSPVQVSRSAKARRKIVCDLMLGKTGNIWVFLNSRLPNYQVGKLLHSGELPLFVGATDIKAESVYGASRLD